MSMRYVLSHPLSLGHPIKNLPTSAVPDVVDEEQVPQGYKKPTPPRIPSSRYGM